MSVRDALLERCCPRSSLATALFADLVHLLHHESCTWATEAKFRGAPQLCMQLIPVSS